MSQNLYKYLLIDPTIIISIYVSLDSFIIALFVSICKILFFIYAFSVWNISRSKQLRNLYFFPKSVVSNNQAILINNQGKEIVYVLLETQKDNDEKLK